MTRRMLLLLTTLCMTLGSIGCGDSGTDVDDDGNISGRYELRTVNGSNLPFIAFQLGNDRVEITAGHIQANSDKTFSVTFTTRTTISGQAQTENDTSTGTWTQTGTQVTFRDPDGSQIVAAVSGGQITVIDNEEGITYVFRR